MNRTALFPGSFDPFTLGHKIVVDQGLELFERIVIAVGVNTEKRGLLTPENRARLIRDLYRNDSRIEVVIYNELTGKVCRQLGIDTILRGLRNTVALDKFFYHILNDFLNIKVSESASIPGGLILFVLLLCTLVAIFQRSHMGVIMKTAGSNPRYARAIGINVNKMRCVGMMLSSALAAIGIQVYAQSYGFMEYYEAPLKLAFTAAAAVLIGGASNKKASVANVLIGTILFQGLLTIALPVANKILPDSSLSEIVRIVISNGIILYALTKAGEKNG